MSQVNAVVCSQCQSPALIVVILQMEPLVLRPYCAQCQVYVGEPLKPVDPSVTARMYGMN